MEEIETDIVVEAVVKDVKEGDKVVCEEWFREG